MSDQTNDEQNTDTNDNDGGNWRRNLEAQLATEKSGRLKAERDLAFKSVKGLDVENNAQHRFFAENYKGDLSSAEIAKQALELGFVKDESLEADNKDIADNARFDNASSNADPIDIAGSVEQKLNAVANGEYKSLAEYEAAVKAAGGAMNVFNR